MLLEVSYRDPVGPGGVVSLRMPSTAHMRGQNRLANNSPVLAFLFLIRVFPRTTYFGF